MASGRNGWRRRGFLRLGVAAFVAAVAARLLPRRRRADGDAAAVTPPGREARHWKQA